ncbi:MAG TPA: hypothetical protein VEY51_11670 [Chondromyces sp.]|nr:hypothetical protein [Chondromyces sp.]
MAGKNKKGDLIEDELDKSGYSAFQWAVFVIIIPLLFAITIALIVMTVAGVDVFEKAKQAGSNIPGLASLINDAPETSTDGESQKQITSLKQEIKDKEAEIEQLTKKLDQSQKEIEDLLVEKDRLEIEMEELKNEDREKENTEDDIIRTYESMSPKNIANILVNLTDNEAVGILSQMSTDKQADILEKLPPETAAQYTKLLSDSTQ